MPRKGANISLSSYDDIFETDESRADRAATMIFLRLMRAAPTASWKRFRRSLSVNWSHSKTIHSRWSMMKQCYEQPRVSHSSAS